MKIYEILSLHEELLKRLNDFGINFTDYRWVSLYNDYLKMKSEGDKVTYIVASLSQRYKVCERKIYKVIRKMEKECQICSVG